MKMNKFAAWISLFASTGTLFCCALPSLLVVLGMGATMAGLVSTFPQLIILSQYKGVVFICSGLMMAAAAFFQYQSRNAPCPIDPVQAQACTTSRVWSFRILAFSILLWSVGVFFAFIAPRVF